MRKFSLIFFCYLLCTSLDPVLSLKCRTGNQQSDEQFQKIIQICRRRYLGYDRENTGYNSRRGDSQESDSNDSEEDMFDRKFLTSSAGRSGNNYNNARNDNSYSSSSGRGGAGMTHQSSNRNSNNNNRSAFSSSYNNTRAYYDPYNNNMNRNNNNNNNYNNNQNQNQMSYNGRSMRNGGSGMDTSYSSYSNRYNNNNNNNNNNNDNNNYGNRNSNSNSNNNDNNDSDDEREQACIVQCFFNELNMVDQRGFPERSSVINIMTQNIQDPELRDFVEESVVECYHYLNNNGRQEKCQFSQSLLSCLAEKGSERCEDWNDDDD